MASKNNRGSRHGAPKTSTGGGSGSGATAGYAPVTRNSGSGATSSYSNPGYDYGGSSSYGYSDSGGSYGGPSGYSDPGSGSLPPAVSAPSEEDYLKGDSQYQVQFAALKAALERYNADTQLQRTNYTTDYNKSLRDLGYTEGLNGGAGSWNWNDQLTASGRAYQNQLNDFASRGMLQSQGYADAASDLERMLNDQYGQLSTNKTNFMTDLDRQLANYKGENTSSQAAARAEAIARRAAQYGL